MKAYFVTGTDTGIGKTHVTGILAQTLIQQGEQVRVLKPIATGCMDQSGGWVSEDKVRLETLLSPAAQIYEGWTFEPPVSPHLAATLAGQCLSAQEVASWCQQQCQTHEGSVLIEGAGGLLVPLNDSETWLDVLKLLQIPVILVVGIRLGCLNHAMLTASVLQAHEIAIQGWVANQMDPTCLYPAALIQTLKQTFSFSCLMELPFEPDLQG